LETTPENSSQLQSERFYTELNAIVDRAENKANGSKKTLQEITNLGKTTIWRWANTVNKALPDPYKLVALLRFESGKENIKDVAAHYGGHIESFLRTNFPSEFASKIHQDFDPANEPKFNDYYSFVIFTLCGTDRKMTVEEIKQSVGQLTLKNSMIPRELWTQEMINAHGQFAEIKIRELVNAGYLAIVDGHAIRTRTHLHLNVVEKIEFVSKNIPTFFKMENVEKEMNGLHFFSDTVTPAYAKKLAREISRFFIQKRDEASTNSDPNGIPIHSIFFMDTMLPETIKEEDGGTLQ